MSACEGEEHLIAAAYHILKALGATKNLDDDLRKIIADLDVHLSVMNGDGRTATGRREFLEVEKRFQRAQKKILSWESSQTMIWDTGPSEVAEYLGAVDDIRDFIRGLEGLSVHKNGRLKEYLYRADSVLQIAMSRLEEELIYILVQHKLYLEPEQMSFRSCQEYLAYDDELFVSVEDESVEETPRRVNSCSMSGELTVDLVHPHVVPDLKSIADLMFASNYDQEFCQAFVGVRREALNEYFVVIGMERISIEDVLKMEWCKLNSEIKKWKKAMKIVIRVYLAGEKQLCQKILGEFGSVSSFCFVEISKTPLLSLLNFGEAIAMGSFQLEKLFSLLDMYEILKDLLVNIDDLLFEEVGSHLRIEFHDLLRKLGRTARLTFLQLGDAVVSDTSIKPLPRGGIHPLTRYVMNYLKTLTIYDHTINKLLEDEHTDCSNPVPELNDEHGIPSALFSIQLQSVAYALECSLINKAKLYKEDALSCIFLTNNIHYMVQKIKNSDLRRFFGDDWIRKHNAKFQQYATNYQRATWSSILPFLRIDSSKSYSFLKATSKESCKEFNIAFEDVYRKQTQWSVPDSQLQEDLRISNLRVVHAYQTFIGLTGISDKHIKYSVDDMEKLLCDFFEGSPKSLNKSGRR